MGKDGRRQEGPEGRRVAVQVVGRGSDGLITCVSRQIKKRLTEYASGAGAGGRMVGTQGGENAATRREQR